MNSSTDAEKQVREIVSPSLILTSPTNEQFKIFEGFDFIDPEWFGLLATSQATTDAILMLRRTCICLNRIVNQAFQEFATFTLPITMQIVFMTVLYFKHSTLFLFDPPRKILYIVLFILFL